jgi:glycerate kinase
VSVVADFAVIGDGETAVIEMSRASGLSLIPPDNLCALKATTYGTGELIKAALDRGAKKIILGIGGSATTDGGAGVLQALGLRFYDDGGVPISDGMGGQDLVRIRSISSEYLDPRLESTEILIACDVTNPLLGPEGAAAVYGPQKGASAEDISFLEKGLSNYVTLLECIAGRSIRDVPGSGAAGGIGAGLSAFTRSAIVNGFDLVCDLVGIEDSLIGADLIITGEGRTDAQTAFGKVPAGVLRLGRERGIPVLLVSGSVDGSVEDSGFNGVASCVSAPMSTREAMDNASLLLETAAERMTKLLVLGSRVFEQ